MSRGDFGMLYWVGFTVVQVAGCGLANAHNDMQQFMLAGLLLVPGSVLGFTIASDAPDWVPITVAVGINLLCGLAGWIVLRRLFTERG